MARQGHDKKRKENVLRLTHGCLTYSALGTHWIAMEDLRR
jgi:hypothetical protein